MTTPEDTVLLIEQTPNDGVCRCLLDQVMAVPFQLLTASCDDPILDLCRSHAVKAVILESCFANSHCLNLFNQLQTQLGERNPAILVIDDDDLGLARQAFKAGAADYLVAEQLTVDVLTQALQATIPLPAGISVETHHRKLAEAALEESETKYRTLFNSIDEGYVLVDVLTDERDQVVDLLYVDANPAAVRMSGTQLVGKRIRELDPNYEDYWFETADRVAKTGIGERHEFYATPRKAWYDFYIFKVSEPNTRRVAFIYKDVTKRKQAEENLQRSAKFNAFRVALTDALRPLVDPIAVQATASYILGSYCNANRVAYFEVQGGHYVVKHDYTSGVASMVGRYPVESFGPDLLATLRAGQTAIAADVTGDFPRSPDQQTAYEATQIVGHIAVPLVKRGELVAGLAVHTATPRDWTPDEIALAEEVAERTWATVERARAEAAVAADLADMRLLRELSTRLVSEHSIQVLYDETLAAAIALMRADGGTLQLLDETTQELVLLTTRGFSQTMVDYFDRVSALSNTSCSVALSQGDRCFLDFEVPESEDPHGTLRMHVEAGYRSGQSTPLISRSGKLIGMVSTFWQAQHRPSPRELRFLDLLARQAADLIQQWRANEERSQLLVREQNARAEAERANRIKDEFLAILSHELRSPLNPILGWTKLLQSNHLDETKTRHALHTIERNAKLQTQLIDDLLDIAKILRGKLEIANTPVSLTAVINAAVDVVKTAAEAKSIAIEVDLSNDYLVRGDDARMQQMIWNLLANAVKFTPAGGRIGVRLAAAGDQAQITVADTGKGISAAFLPRLFDAFRQEDTSITRRYGGLGLGLSIVKYLAEAHGGTITAASPGEGQGATFILALPLLNEQMHCLLDTERSPQPPNLSEVNVLAVDDSDDARELLATLLMQYGAAPKVVASGQELLAQLQTFRPDVLVCDLSMPDMDGYTLLQQVRALPPEQGGTVAAIAVTAYAREEDRQRALEDGFQAHLAKPIEPEKLASAIAALTRQ